MLAELEKPPLFFCFFLPPFFLSISCASSQSHVSLCIFPARYVSTSLYVLLSSIFFFFSFCQWLLAICSRNQACTKTVVLMQQPIYGFAWNLTLVLSQAKPGSNISCPCCSFLFLAHGFHVSLERIVVSNIPVLLWSQLAFVYFIQGEKKKSFSYIFAILNSIQNSWKGVLPWGLSRVENMSRILPP